MTMQRENELAHAVIGAAEEVHSHLGPGFTESTYEEALCIELTRRGVPFRRQAVFALTYKGRPIGEGRADLIVGDDVVVELKAQEGSAALHTAQLVSYLKATNKTLGVLINFNVRQFMEGVKRVVLSEESRTG